MTRNFLFLALMVLCLTVFGQSEAEFSFTDCNKLNLESSLGGDDGYLLLLSTNTIQFNPVDGTTYPYQVFFGTGADFSPFADGEHIVYNGDQNTFVENLDNGQSYHYKIFYYSMITGVPVYSSSPSANSNGIVEVPDEVDFDLTVEPISCFGANDGYVRTNITSGQGAFDYFISGIPIPGLAPMETEVEIDNLFAGPFTMTVENEFGCLETKDLEILEPMPSQISLLASSDATCFNKTDGTAVLSLSVDGLSGSILTYSLDVVGDDVQTVGLDTTANGNLILHDMAAGVYELIVKQDQNTDCAVSTMLEIESPAELKTTGTSITNTDCVDENGIISLNISGGEGAFDVQWYDEAGTLIGSTQDVSALGAGEYTAVIEDESACTIEEQFEVGIDFTKCFDEDDIVNVISPNNDSKNDYWTVEGLSSMYPNNKVTIYNRWGDVVFEDFACPDNCWNGKSIYSRRSLPAGTYFYVIEKEYGSKDMFKGSINLIK